MAIFESQYNIGDHVEFINDDGEVIKGGILAVEFFNDNPIDIQYTIQDNGDGCGDGGCDIWTSISEEDIIKIIRNMYD